MEPILVTRELTRTYTTGGPPVHAARQVDLSLYAGDFTVLMGSSGSGKSTVLYLLAGLEDPTSGSIRLAGRRLERCSARELSLLRRTGVGFVFQGVHLVPELTLIENIEVAGALVWRDREALRRRAADLLDQLGIGDLADRLPAHVSGGQAQRAAIARALVNDPAVLIADEPTGSLNSAASEQVLDVLHQVHARGQTVLMATHAVEAAARGSRILYLRDGRVVDELRLDEGVDDADRCRHLHAWLQRRGW